MEAKQLRRIPLFQHVSPTRLNDLLAGAYVEQYEKGATLFRQGAQAKAIWVVLEGWIHLVRSSKSNDASRAVVIFTITPSEVLCGISAIESGTYNLSAVAATDCRVIRLPGEAFRKALMHEADFAYHTLCLCARRLRHIAQQYGSMAEPVSHRLIRAILRLHEQFGVTLPVTHRELAQMSWTTTESAIRMIRRLKQHGYVTGTRGRLTITKSNALERLLVRSNGHPTL